MTFDTVINAADNSVAMLLFAHGAGKGMDSEFMEVMAHRLAEQGISVLRFNFPYMQTISQTGKRRPPDRMDKLEAHFSTLIAKQQEATSLPLFIGGKSMGGRVATHLVNQHAVRGAVAFGYPFHPPGKFDKLRTAHLESVKKPIHILQGERDTFGNREEVASYPLSRSVSVEFLPDGDHSFKPRKSSQVTLEQNLQSAAMSAAAFIQARSG